MAETRVTFNEVFREANATHCRYRVLLGSAGSGKSYNTAQDFILKLSDPSAAGANLLVIRKTESSNRGSTFAELSGAVRRIFGEKWQHYFRITDEPMMLESLVTGSRIVFRGMKDAAQRERVKSISFPSGKLTFIWCEEATELTAGDFEILDDRLRGELPPSLYYQITLTFNPVSATHWIKRRFFDAAPSPDVFLHRSVYGENAFIDSGFRARMERRKNTDPDGYRVYGLGEWGGSGDGLILTGWRVAQLSQNTADYDTCWMAQDFGYNHHDCLLLVGMKDGVLYVLREIYVRLLDTSEIIEIAEAMDFPKELPMYCDSAEPDRIKMWKKAGWRARPAKKGAGSVAAQIDILKQLDIVVDERCVSVIGELENWRWMKDDATDSYTDIPEPLCDDAMAALRYSTEYFSGARLASISKADLGI